MKALASDRQEKRSGNNGPYFIVLNKLSLYGLSLLTRGLEWDRVTSKSASSAATVLDVIEVPRSALNRIRFNADYAEENAKPRDPSCAHAARGIGVFSSA